MPGADSRKTTPAVTGVDEGGKENNQKGTGEKPPPGAPTGDRSGITVTAIVVACVIVCYYLGFMAYLAVKRDDPGWDHLLFLLSGLEAIVFAAGGLLFGTTIQRGVVQHARAEAGSARADANKARKLADRFEEKANGGEAVAAVARGMPKPAATPRPGAAPREDEARRRAEKTAADYELWHTALLGLVDTYFPASGKD